MPACPPLARPSRQRFAYVVRQLLRTAATPRGVDEYLVVAGHLKRYSEQSGISMVVGHPGNSEAVSQQCLAVQARQDESPCGPFGGLPGMVAGHPVGAENSSVTLAWPFVSQPMDLRESFEHVQESLPET